MFRSIFYFSQNPRVKIVGSPHIVERDFSPDFRKADVRFGR
jgi:hypothetical protein